MLGIVLKRRKGGNVSDDCLQSQQCFSDFPRSTRTVGGLSADYSRTESWLGLLPLAVAESLAIIPLDICLRASVSV